MSNRQTHVQGSPKRSPKGASNWVLSCLLGMLLIPILIPSVEFSAKESPKITIMAYELYSRKEPDGSWSFYVRYNTSSETTVKEVFDKKRTLHGTDAIRRKIFELPEGSTVFWLCRIPSGTMPGEKGSERLKYPADKIIDQLRQFTKRRKVTIQTSEDCPKEQNQPSDPVN